MALNRQVVKTLSIGLLGVGAAAITVACAPTTDTASTAPEENVSDSLEESPSDPSEMDLAAGSEPATVVALLNEQGDFNTLTQALTEAELTEALSQGGPYTIFAPTDAAFAALPEGTLEKLLLPENRQLLQEVLAYHVTTGALTSDQLASGEVTTLQGEPVEITTATDGVTVGNAQVTEPDLEAVNGVVHGIDTVLLPPNLQL